MAEEGFKRKLAAILSADAVGYSRLMAEDEAATVKTIATYREIMSSLIKQHRGRVVDSPGDNVLAEFSSVVDAVQCAVATQNEFQTRNAELAENRRMEFRIGINLGDVIDEEDRIYGDGVNIAARLESLADPGGICVSKTAFDQIETKLPLGYEYLGERSVKNIPKPVGAYRVLMKPDAAGKVIGEKRFLGRLSRRTALAAIVMLVVVAGGLIGWNIYLQQSKKVEPASVEKMAFPLPEKPSIAVLPFDNMTGDPKQEYLCDGISEQIITSLSMIPRLFVIARNSTFTYKGRAVKIQQVAEELGVRYVLEGSVQKAGDKLRITAQLIDAIKGYHVWSERYDQDLKDVFALQDEIANKTMTVLQVELTEGEYAAMIAGTTSNLKALESFWHAEKHHFRFNQEDNASAHQWIVKAIELDPQFSGAWALLGYIHLNAARNGWSESPVQSMKQAAECAKKALAINDSSAKAWILMANIYLAQKHFDEAEAYGEKGIALSPNDPLMLADWAWVLFTVGRHEEAVRLVKRAMRLSPYYPAYFLTILYGANVLAGKNEDALAAAKALLDRCEKGEYNCFFPHLFLAMAYSELGLQKEARAHAAELVKMDPNFTCADFFTKGIYFKNKKDTERGLNACRKAGLK